MTLLLPLSIASALLSALLNWLLLSDLLALCLSFSCFHPPNAHIYTVSFALFIHLICGSVSPTFLFVPIYLYSKSLNFFLLALHSMCNGKKSGCTKVPERYWCYSFLSLYLTPISPYFCTTFPPLHLAMNSLDLFILFANWRVWSICEY